MPVASPASTAWSMPPATAWQSSPPAHAAASVERRETPRAGVAGLARAPVSAHALRQPERDDRKGDEDDEAHDVGRHERQDALEDRREADVLDDALDDEDVHAHGRVDEAELDRHDDDDAEPDRIEA